MPPSNSLPDRATVAQASALLGRSQPIIRGYIAKRNLKPDKSGRYQLAPLAAEKLEAEKRRAKPAITGPDDAPRSWSDRKKAKEIEKLQLQIDELKGDLLPVEFHQSEMRTLCGWFRDVFAQWISEVKVLTGDARVVAEAERLRDKALTRMQEKCK